MGGLGHDTDQAAAGACDVCTHNGGDEKAAQHNNRAIKRFTGSRGARYINSAYSANSAGNYTSTRTRCSMGFRNRSDRLDCWRAYYTRRSSTAQYAPDGGSGRPGSAGTVRITALDWVADR